MPQHPTKYLKKIGPISWTKLFHNWEKREASQAGWQRHYRERGFSSWREWRTTAYKDLQPATRTWTLYKVEQPQRVVSTWFGGPFRGWRRHYHGRAVTFKTLATRRTIQNHTKVQSILKHFPPRTEMIGVVWQGRIVVIEGMHRACAVALATQKGKKINSTITIALTPLSGKLPNLSSRHKK